jgi:hypothetical protein
LLPLLPAEGDVAKKACLLAIGLAAIAVVGGPSREAQAQELSIVLSLRDYSGLPESVLLDARAHVADIFDRAGVKTMWRDNAQFTVIILSAAMAGPLHQAAERLGFTPITRDGAGRVAYVLEARVNAAARVYRVHESVILAVVIAHELGHLLLPPHAHSSIGLMRAAWNESDFFNAKRRNLLFAGREARLIRATIAR